MIRRISILAAVLAVSLTGGCDWPWSEKKIESTSETRAKYMASVTELVKVRGESKGYADAAREAVKSRNEEAFQQRLLDLRINLERQIELMNAAEESASTHEIRKSIREERERTEFDLKQITEYEKIWRAQVELAAWREIGWR